MAQLKQVCTVANGGQTVTVIGTNVAYRIKKNAIFMVTPDLVPYVIAQDATFDGVNTVVTLSAAYQGTTASMASGVFATDFTVPDNLPLISQGDVGTAAIWTKAMYQIQDMIKTVSPSGLAASVDDIHATLNGAQVASATAVAAKDSALGSATTSTNNANTAAGAIAPAQAARDAAQLYANTAGQQAIAAAASAAAASAAAASIAGRLGSVNVVVITGQSNAAGAHNGGPNPANPNVKVWDGVTGAWGSSDYTQPPFSRVYPDGNNGNNNTGLSFAHRLADESGGKVYVIYDAWGGRPIEDWVSAGTSSVRYAAIRAKVQAALASTELAGRTTVDYLIWAQGEANGLTDDFPTYQGKFTTLDTQFRAESWMKPTTPMLVMGMSGLHTRYQVWQAQVDYCENVNRACIYVNSMGCKTSYDVTASEQINVDSTTNFNVGDMITNTVNGITATGTVVQVGSSVLSVGNVSGIFQAGPLTSSSGGSANITSVVDASDFTHWLGDSLWELGYHRCWYALQERGMSHRLQTTSFYGRGSGPWKLGNTVALAMFKSMVSYSSLTSTFPPNGSGASDCISWGYQCVASNNSTAGGYQTTQDSLARYGMLWGRSLSATSGADYHAGFGYQNTLSATYGFAAGRGHTVADSGGAALGLFSKYTTAQTNQVLFQVGIGTSTSNAKNAITCRADGAVEINTNSTSNPTQKREIKFEWVSNTQVKLKLHGDDDVIRSITFTVA